MEKYRKIFKEYAERMKKIRLLSTPDLSEIDDSSEYSRTLIANFSQIGEFAVKNRKIINEFIKPLISSDERLSEEDKQRLSLFVEFLVEDETFEEIDVHLSEFMNDLLVNDDIRIDDAIDDSTKVISMAKKVKRDYYMVSALTRYPNENAEIMRKYAQKNRDMLESYLEKDIFETLSDEAGDYEKEVAEGCGTHYAPFLPGLFKMPALRSDIEYLLSEGRQKMYQETFRLITLNGSR